MSAVSHPSNDHHPHPQVSACGFDSIPADLGTLYTAAQFPSSGQATQVKSFLTVDGGALGVVGHFTTFECAVHGFGSQKALSTLRKQSKRITLSIPGPRPKNPGTFYVPKEIGKHCLPFPGSDAAIVRRTQQVLFTYVPVCILVGHCRLHST